MHITFPRVPFNNNMRKAGSAHPQKLSCEMIPALPFGSGAAGHHLIVVKYTLYSLECVSALILVSYVVPTPKILAVKHCLLWCTHQIGATSHHLMVLERALYSWECDSTVIWANQALSTLKNSTLKFWVTYGLGAASHHLMILKHTLYSLEYLSTIIQAI